MSGTNVTTVWSSICAACELEQVCGSRQAAGGRAGRWRDVSYVYLKSARACDRALEGPQLYPNPNTALRLAADMVEVRLDRALVASSGSLMLSNGW